MTYASTRIIIDVSADAIWRVIGDFGAACQYLAMVEKCTVEGQGIGAPRTLTSPDGSTIVERLENAGRGVPSVELRPVDRHALLQLRHDHGRE